MVDMKATCRILLSAIVLLIALPAMAHHSAAMFDFQQSVTLSGTVKEFQWTNPHVWIQLLVPTADESGTEEWSIQMGSPSQVFRGGWTPATLKPGDKIIVRVHPMRDGSRGGDFISATSTNGKTLGKQHPIGGA